MDLLNRIFSNSQRMNKRRDICTFRSQNEWVVELVVCAWFLKVTVHIPPLWRRSSRAAIQAAAMAGIGGEGRLARAAAMSVQA